MLGVPDNSFSNIIRPIIFVSDVPVERTAGGMLLLFRMFQAIPPEKLIIVGNVNRPGGKIDGPRLDGVQYVNIDCRVPKVIRGNKIPFWPYLLPRVLKEAKNRIVSLVREVGAGSIIASPFEFLWLAGLMAARETNIPYHLILHDDWSCTVTNNQPGIVGAIKRFFVNRMMRKAYRQASSRLCISHNMEKRYRRSFGCSGTVLLPTSGPDSPVARIRVRENNAGPPVVAYCGTMHQVGTVILLKDLAEKLKDCGGSLEIYTPHTKDHLASNGLDKSNIRDKGFMSPAEMAESLCYSAHALLLPASFERKEKIDISTLFPSKLVDYTAIGLPIVIWAPPYSSVWDWHLRNPGCYLGYSGRNPGPIMEIIEMLRSDSFKSKLIVENAIRVGNTYFSFQSTIQNLQLALLSQGKNLIGRD